MGWDGTWLRPTETRMENARARYETPGSLVEKVLDARKVGTTLYFLLLIKTGEVTIDVVLTQKGSDDMTLFKFLSETCHPFEYRAPLAWLDRLTPTTNENALSWRQGVRDVHARLKADKELEKANTQGFYDLASPMTIRHSDSTFNYVYIPQRKKGDKLRVYPIQRYLLAQMSVTAQNMDKYLVRKGEPEYVYVVGYDYPVRVQAAFKRQYGATPFGMKTLNRPELINAEVLA